MNHTPTAQITALLHRYAHRLDAGDFVSVAAMFGNAMILVNDAINGDGLRFRHRSNADVFLPEHPGGRLVVAGT